MPKTMARIEGQNVINMEWYSDSQEETDVLKNIGDLPVGIGDQYIDGVFYHQGSEVLTPLEQARKEVYDLQVQLENSYTEEEVNAAYQEGVNSI